MDPNATLAALLESNDVGEALEHALNLLEWLAKGGAAPRNFADKMKAAPALLDDLLADMDDVDDDDDD